MDKKQKEKYLEESLDKIIAENHIKLDAESKACLQNSSTNSVLFLIIY
ncbi:MAG: hypothetical protein MUO82_06960 [Candidatus Thermoplasmatota archaeon]|nr:hypothetical protein [Candidatus Thermoplasmatota archaeon]